MLQVKKLIPTKKLLVAVVNKKIFQLNQKEKEEINNTKIGNIILSIILINQGSVRRNRKYVNRVFIFTLSWFFDSFQFLFNNSVIADKNYGFVEIIYFVNPTAHKSL